MSESLAGNTKHDLDPEKTNSGARRAGDVTLVGFRGEKSKTPPSQQNLDSSLSETSTDLGPTQYTIPNQVGHFQIHEEIARGGMGAIHRARDLDIGRDVAVKLISSEYHEDSSAVQRFLKEARISGQLQHPGVVPVYELGFLPARGPFFAMKLVQGKTLARLLKDRQSPNENLSKYLGIFEYVCQTIAYAHSRRIIHRDLKPQNIMVGEFGEVQVMDWGLAKSLDVDDAESSWVSAHSNGDGTPPPMSGSLAIATAATGMSLRGAVQGTPSYMSPEQARGKSALDERCDVFGLGAILCEILTGKPPYRSGGGSQALADAQLGDLTETFERLKQSSADSDLQALSLHCLAAEAANRPSSAIEVADRMRVYLASVQQRLQDAELEKAAAQVKAREERKARRLTLALAVSLSIFAIGAALIGLRMTESKRTAREEKERAIGDAIHRAHLLREEALATPGQNEKWAQAMAQVKRAEELLSNSELSPAFRERADPILSDLNQKDRDRKILSRFEKIRLEASEVKDGTFNMRGVVPAYAEAFREYGIDVETLLEKAAPELMKRDIHNQLAAAIDDWGAVSVNFVNDKTIAGHLFALADLIDPDEWRGKLRQAHLNEDRNAFLELGKSANPKAQPVTALYMLAATLTRLGENNLAADLLMRTRREYPSDFWVTHQLAMCLQNTSPPRPLESIGYYHAAATLRPNSPGVQVNLGVAYHDMGQDDAYIEATREAIRLKPDYSEAYLNLGSAYLSKNRFDDAMAEYRKALNFKPTFSLGHRQVGMVYETLGELELAIASYRTACQYAPNDFMPALKLAMVLFQTKRPVTESIAILKRISAARKTDPDLWFQLGVCYIWDGKYEEAMGAMQKCEDLCKGQPRRYPSDSWLQRCEKLIELRPELDEILSDQLKPESFRDCLNFALLCASRNCFAKATQFMGAAIKLSEDKMVSSYVDCRIEGARYASLVSTSQVEDAKGFSAENRKAFRDQATQWLSEILNLDEQQLDSSFGAKGDAYIEQQTRAGKAAWQIRRERFQIASSIVNQTSVLQFQEDFRVIRDADSCKQYSESEQQALRKFWQRVAEVRRKAIAAMKTLAIN